MRKVRIMLLSLFVFAAVGAALAFKAKDANFCIYSEKVNGLGVTTCPFLFAVNTVTLTTNVAIPSVFYTSVKPVGNCPATVPVASCTLRVEDYEIED